MWRGLVGEKQKRYRFRKIKKESRKSKKHITYVKVKQKTNKNKPETRYAFDNK